MPNDSNIPDMSLGERHEKPASPATPLPPRDSEIQPPDRPTPRSNIPPEPAKEKEPQWEEGDRVLAPWEPTCVYPGTIRQIQLDDDKGDQALIRYDDGGEGWVFLYSLCPYEFKIGQQVYVRQQNANAYDAAELADVDEREVRVRYDNDRTEWVPIKMLRIPCIANGPGAMATQSAPWQTPAQTGEGGIPSWMITVGVIILIAFLRFGCRAMLRD